MKYEITEEQRVAIAKLQKKAVIKDTNNRFALQNMKMEYHLGNISNGINQIIYYIGSIAEGQMAQNGMLKTSLQNLEVEINKLRKLEKKVEMSSMVVVYGTEVCPKCSILKKKLKDKNIDFEDCRDIDRMKSLGINSIPIMQIDGGNLMEFSEAIEFINKY